MKEQQREAKARAAAERKLEKKAEKAAEKAQVLAEKEREKAEAAAVARAAAAAAEQMKAAKDEAERARLRAEAQAKTDAANRRKLPPSAAVGDGTVAAGITSSLVSVIFLLCRAARAVVAGLVNMPERVAVYERVFAPLFEQPPRLAVFAFAHYASNFLNGAWVFAVGRCVAFPSSSPLSLLFIHLISCSCLACSRPLAAPWTTSTSRRRDWPRPRRSSPRSAAARSPTSPSATSSSGSMPRSPPPCNMRSTGCGVAA